MSRSVKRDGYRVSLSRRNFGHVHNERFRLEFAGPRSLGTEAPVDANTYYDTWVHYIGVA